MRWAVCATGDASILLDLTGVIAARKVAEAPFASVTWSANGTALLLDGARLANLDAADLAPTATSSHARAISDAGLVSEDDDVLAFDGEAALSVRESAIHRLEAGKAEEIYLLDFTPQFLAASGDSLIAAAGQRLARISRTSLDVAYFDLPVDATILRLLADGSMLVAEPGPGEPGWLFRWTSDDGGSLRFVPGIPVDEMSTAPAALEVRQ